MFFPLMMARPLKSDFILEPDQWAAEEKFDGIRILAHVEGKSDDLFMDKKVTPWSRYGIIHPLPTHILEVLAKLPDGWYDGEIFVPGKRSYGTTEIKNQSEMIFVIFDIPHPPSFAQPDLSYDLRRLGLLHLAEKYGLYNSVCIAASTQVNTWDEIYALRDAVWARDGEGLILKQRDSIYQIGKRPKTWLKIKKLQHATLTVTGFVATKGLIIDRGPCAIVLLRDDEGNETAVKTKNDAECLRLAKLHSQTQVHPEVGRRLCIEYQERTPDGNYRHPRWDRWEDE